VSRFHAAIAIDKQPFTWSSRVRARPVTDLWMKAAVVPRRAPQSTGFSPQNSEIHRELSTKPTEEIHHKRRVFL
jgi:hypothetical protein